MSENIAHNIENQSRTADIYVSENVDFSGMMLSKHVLDGLTKCNFRKPSPIQLKAIPLGKIGIDLIVQAKSGTGKTVVFSVLALESFTQNPSSLNVIILTPTREIAVQIKDVLTAIGSEITDLKVEYFVGGLPIEGDKEKLKTCHIAVGAPGRIKHLIEKGFLPTKKVKMFILDEADKLMSESFQNDILAIFKKLPKNKQVIACSATYPKSFDDIIQLMNSPSYVNPGTDIPTLLGLKQLVSLVPFNLNIVKSNLIKINEIIRIFSSVPFKQCIVFTNYQTRAETVSNFLNQSGWPSTFITGSQTQVERLEAIKKIRNFNYRILISTDLTSRGIDIENINLVINFDVPYNGATYLHRIGRSGRFGSHGICITICSEGTEFDNFMHIISSIGNSTVWKLPNEKIPENLWQYDCDKLEKLYSHSEENEQKNDETCKTIENDTEELNNVNLKKAAEAYAENNLKKDIKEINNENQINEIAAQMSTIEIQNSTHGVPMIQDLSTTPQAIKEKQKQEEIVKKNLSLLEVTKLLLNKDHSEICEETYSKTNESIQLLDHFDDPPENLSNESNEQITPNLEIDTKAIDITEETINKIEYLSKSEVTEAKNHRFPINQIEKNPNIENEISKENHTNNESNIEHISVQKKGDLYTNYGMKSSKTKNEPSSRKKQKDFVVKDQAHNLSSNNYTNLDYFQEGYRRGLQDAQLYNPCSKCNPNYHWYEMWKEQSNQIQQYAYNTFYFSDTDCNNYNE